MNDDRFPLELAKFEKALTQLRDALAPDESRQARNSLLLSFLFTFETASKALRAGLARQGLSTPDFAAAVLRGGLQARMIENPEVWEKLREYRNGVAHAYDEALAVEIAAYVRAHAQPAFEGLHAKLKALA